MKSSSNLFPFLSYISSFGKSSTTLLYLPSNLFPFLSYKSSSFGESPIIGLYLPSNFFPDLSNNSIPGVSLFIFL